MGFCARCQTLSPGGPVRPDFANYLYGQLHGLVFRQTVAPRGDPRGERIEGRKRAPVALFPRELFKLPQLVYGDQGNLWSTAQLNNYRLVGFQNIVHESPKPVLGFCGRYSLHSVRLYSNHYRTIQYISCCISYCQSCSPILW